MPVNAPAQSVLQETAWTVEQRILRSTRGRIHQLTVEAAADHLTVRAYAPSYFVKQLVIQAVMDALGQPGSVPVDLDVRVMADRPRAPEGTSRAIAVWSQA
ncbi:MAG TPA: hypothetical protein VK395_34975 [Gemmataceae bacterium]|nr:hypothetical protein [Gemmataceae bacterium]